MDNPKGVAISLLVLSLGVACGVAFFLKPQRFKSPEGRLYKPQTPAPLEVLSPWERTEASQPLLSFFELKYDEKTQKLGLKPPLPLSPLRWAGFLGSAPDAVFLLHNEDTHSYHQARLGDSLGRWRLLAYEGDTLTLGCGAYREEIKLKTP